MILNRIAKSRKESLIQNKNLCKKLMNASVIIQGLINLLELVLVFLLVANSDGNSFSAELWGMFAILVVDILLIFKRKKDLIYHGAYTFTFILITFLEGYCFLVSPSEYSIIVLIVAIIIKPIILDVITTCSGLIMFFKETIDEAEKIEEDSEKEADESKE